MTDRELIGLMAAIWAAEHVSPSLGMEHELKNAARYAARLLYEVDMMMANAMGQKEPCSHINYTERPAESAP